MPNFLDIYDLWVLYRIVSKKRSLLYALIKQDFPIPNSPCKIISIIPYEAPSFSASLFLLIYLWKEILIKINISIGIYVN